MGRVIGGMAAVILCFMAGLVTIEARREARLREAQEAFDDAASLKESGRYTDAILESERGLAIIEMTQGPNHPAFARAVGNVAALYYEQGQYARARPLHEKALAIQEKAFGKHHPDVAKSLNNLGLVHSAQGLHEQAEPLHLRALDIQQAALGGNHPDVARTLNHLGRIEARRGFHERAERRHERALSIQEAVLGKSHPDVAETLDNLARLRLAQGMYEQAESLFKQTLAIRELALGSNHPGVAGARNNLAALYERQGLHSRALPLYEGALSILEATRGRNHPDVAGALNNLALFHSGQGQDKEAEPLHLRALTLQERLLGASHPDVATSLNNLARLYFRQGEHSLAELLQERALVIQEATLEEDHPDVVQSLHNLGELRLAQHRLPEAVSLLARAFTLSEHRLRREALYLSEARLAKFLQLLRKDEERLYALLRAHPDDIGVQRLALKAVLLRKGRSAGEIAGISRAVHHGLDEKGRETFAQLRDLRRQRARLSRQGPGTLAPADYQQRLKDLARRGDVLEAKLARRSAPLRVFTEVPPPEDIIDRVVAALPPESALVELVAYTDQPLIPRLDTSRPQLRYLALVLSPDASIRVVDLGPAAPIDRAAIHLRDVLARRDAHYLRPAQELHALAFEPLRPHLGGVRRLFLAPDGQLGLVPFHGLHDGRRFLIDEYDVSDLTSGKDLLPRSQELPPPSNSGVVFADPVLDDAPSVAPARSATGERLVESPWARLPGTRREAEAIQRLLPQTQLFLGAEATRQRLLQVSAPGFLHIATHGYFGNATASRGARGLGVFGGFGGGAPAQCSSDPLLRSGLVLAGGRASTTNATEAEDDSRVTALELASLNLWGTQLVVLSACDTGRGDVQLGQGVYGLRRAFFIAGAETVVMSLWKVNDDSTHLLMEHYYRELKAGKGRSEALRNAARTLRETWPHPHYWAPFISVGRDGPVRLPTPGAPADTTTVGG